MAFIAAAIIGGVGAVAGGLIGAHGASSAANAQASSANYAASLQKQQADEALAFQKEQFATQQQNLAPWLSTGRNALGSLGYLMGVNPTTTGATSSTTGPGVVGTGTTGAGTDVGTTGTSDSTIGGGRGYDPSQALAVDANGNPLPTGTPADPGTTTSTADGTTGTQPAVNTNLGSYGSLMQPWNEQFTAPTDVTEQNDPGYKFRLQQGEDALQASAAAKGNLFTGGTMKALGNYAQDYASKEYGDVYGRAFNEYAQRYNQFQTNNTNQYNRLANLAGMGQTTADQLGLMGQNAANNTSSILLNSGQQIGNDYQNAGAARASGYVGTANALGGALGGIGGNLTQLMMLSKLFPGSGGGGTLADPSICWVAAELYGGWTNARTIAVRQFLTTSTLPRIVRFVDKYREHGQEWAEMIRIDRDKRAKFRRLFDGFLQEATA